MPRYRRGPAPGVDPDDRDHDRELEEIVEGMPREGPDRLLGGVVDPAGAAGGPAGTRPRARGTPPAASHRAKLSVHGQVDAVRRPAATHRERLMGGNRAEVHEAVDRLPPDPGSVGRARRFVASALTRWELHAVVDDATLLVSEVVTNSILHAGTELEIRVRRGRPGVRIEVHDGSPVLPTPRHYGEDAVTGRGLGILESTAVHWGAVRTPTGKLVWFDLGGTGAAADRPVEPAGEARRSTYTVRLLALPANLMRATIEYGDAMIRELALLAVADDVEDLPLPLVTTPDLDLGPLLTSIDRAVDAGLASVDATLELPSSAPDGAVERLALIDEADRLARDAKLLLPPALPEIGHCRTWLLTEIVLQAAGRPPTRWELPDPTVTEGEWTPLAEEEVASLGEARGRSILADERNRILFVGDDAAALLGWEPADLAGRRLTTIVPPELREAHLVGFTRHQLTGRANLLGRRVAVRALRRDGTRVDVALVIEPRSGPAGRRRYHATLQTA